ncbi:MAG TPA: alpha/beta hydrolase [Acidimicrobiales bacterium]
MSKPTIVLVHGAFADAAVWRPVFDLLSADDYPVLAPPNPLRGLAHDAAYIGAVLDEIEPPVVLVGHSYGAAVVTVAGATEKVSAVVYAAGLVPDEGESLSDLQSHYPSLAMGPLFQQRMLADGAVEVSIDPHQFQSVFCADVPEEQATFLAHAQRPLLASAFDEPAASVAWHTKPSWAVFGTQDRPVAPALHRFQNLRAGVTATEVEDASHFVMLSRPDAVADVIRQAADYQA